MVESPEPPWSLYERHSALWTRLRLPGVGVEATWLDSFRDLLPSNARVLDIGCGHGHPIGSELLLDGYEVWGIDRAPSLIELARSDLPRGRWLVADMSSFDLGQTFAGFVMWHSLFHLTPSEQRLVFPLVAAHAEPGAVLLFTTGPAAGSTNGEFGGDVLAHHSLDPVEYADLLASQNFTVLQHRQADPDCGDATVWLAEHSNFRGEVASAGPVV